MVGGKFGCQDVSVLETMGEIFACEEFICLTGSRRLGDGDGSPVFRGNWAVGWLIYRML